MLSSFEMNSLTKQKYRNDNSENNLVTPVVSPDHLILTSLVSLLEASESSEILGSDAGLAQSQSLITPLSLLLQILHNQSEEYYR